MKRILAAILSLIIILSLAACQPTPEQGVVAEKDSERMLAEAQKDTATASSSNSLSEQYGIPETYQFETQGADGLLNIKVDAQVIVSDGDRMPIYRVKAAEFSQDTVYAFFEALCGDAEMWIDSGQKTKEEIQQQIVNIKKRITELEADPGDLSEELAEQELAMARETLASLEAQLETAPDTIVEEHSDGTLREISSEQHSGPVPGTALEEGVEEPAETPSTETITYTGLTAYERYNQGINGQGRYFNIINDINPTMHYSDFRNQSAGVNFSSSGSIPIIEDTDVDVEILSKVGLKPSEARQMVQDLLDKTGSGMVVDSIYIQNDEQKGNYEEAARPAERYAYKVYCVRTVDGFPCSYVSGGSRPENDATAPTWHYECLDFMVNGDGIFDMMWMCPIGVAETVNEDAQLKPFSDIQEIFEKMMLVKYEAQAEYGGTEYSFEINRVTLSLHRIVEQNSNESGLLVPAWNFYGKLTKLSEGNPYGATEEIGISFMTINAIDGSIIDTSKGY